MVCVVLEWLSVLLECFVQLACVMYLPSCWSRTAISGTIAAIAMPSLSIYNENIRIHDIPLIVHIHNTPLQAAHHNLQVGTTGNAARQITKTPHNYSAIAQYRDCIALLSQPAMSI